MATPNLTELVATNIRNRKKEFADNVTNNNPLLYRMEEKGNIVANGGGTSIVCEIMFAENATAGFYSGSEILSTDYNDTLSAAEYDWKQASVQITANGLETRVINKGPEKMIDLLNSRIDVGMASLKNTISASLYSDGTGSSGKEIGGLQLLVADDPTTGTVGGINSATYDFWRNKIDNTTMSTANVQTRLNLMWLNLTRNNDKPDLIVGDSEAYQFYEASLQQYQRFADSDMAAAGFNALKYKSADVVYDDTSDAAGDNRFYMLNTDYLKFQVDPDSMYEPLEQRASVNQDAFVIPVVFCGNLICSNRSLQGVIFE